MAEKWGRVKNVSCAGDMDKTYVSRIDPIGALSSWLGMSPVVCEIGLGKSVGLMGLTMLDHPGLD